MAEKKSIEDLIDDLRVEARLADYNDDISAADALLRAADALEAGLRVAKPFVRGIDDDALYAFRGDETVTATHSTGEIRALRDWTKGIYT